MIEKTLKSDSVAIQTAARVTIRHQEKIETLEKEAENTKADIGLARRGGADNLGYIMALEEKCKILEARLEEQRRKCDASHGSVGSAKDMASSSDLRALSTRIEDFVQFMTEMSEVQSKDIGDVKAEINKLLPRATGAAITKAVEAVSKRLALFEAREPADKKVLNEDINVLAKENHLLMQENRRLIQENKNQAAIIMKRLEGLEKADSSHGVQLSNLKTQVSLQGARSETPLNKRKSPRKRGTDNPF